MSEQDSSGDNQDVPDEEDFDDDRNESVFLLLGKELLLPVAPPERVAMHHQYVPIANFTFHSFQLQYL